MADGTRATNEDTQPPAGARRTGRFWLYAPFGLLALLAVAWSAAWFAIRDRAVEALDGFVAKEAAAGRRWSCPDRRVGGYPFRIEVACPAEMTVQRPDATLSLGRLRAVAQVYQPRHVIVEAEGPLRVSGGGEGEQGPVLSGQWQNLRASLRAASDGFQRASVVVQAPRLRLDGLPAAGEVSATAERLEVHVRPDPGRSPDEAALDWVTRATRVGLPGLDALLGGSEPTDVELQLAATQVRGDALGSPLAEALDDWRRAGGRLDIALLSLVKGPRRIEGKGQIGLDDLHRPAGRLDVAASGLGGLLGLVTGGSGAGPAGGLLGSLLGRPPRPDAPAPVAPPRAGGAPAQRPALDPLPQIRLENGRVFLGPVQIPRVRLAPLY